MVCRSRLRAVRDIKFLPGVDQALIRADRSQVGVVNGVDGIGVGIAAEFFSDGAQAIA